MANKPRFLKKVVFYRGTTPAPIDKNRGERIVRNRLTAGVGLAPPLQLFLACTGIESN